MAETNILKIENGKVEVPEAENQCAFHIKTIDNVCSDSFTLAKMEEFINKLNSNIEKNAKPAEIVEKAKEVTGCNSEICILKNKQFENIVGPVKIDSIIEERFKPEGPSNTTEWLNNDNIDYVIDQWSKIHKDFLHIPFQMSDFDEKKTALAMLDLSKEYNNNIRRVGCVINTDKSTGRGIHWFCIFAHMNEEPWTLEYFDSAGNYPVRSVHTLLNTQRMKLAETFPNKSINVVDVTRNNQLQQSSTECGVFSLWYLYSRLNGIPYSYFSQPEATTDDMMYKFRKFLFRPDRKSGGKIKKSKKKINK